jgi:hypothetical protein
MINQLNNLVQNYFQQWAALLAPSWREYLSYVSNLTPHQIAILTAVTAVLLAIYVYKKLGINAVFILLVVYLIYYTVFYSNLFTNWQNDKREKDRRMQIYNAEMQIK